MDHSRCTGRGDRKQDWPAHCHQPDSPGDLECEGGLERAIWEFTGRSVCPGCPAGQAGGYTLSRTPTGGGQYDYQSFPIKDADMVNYSVLSPPALPDWPWKMGKLKMVMGRAGQCSLQTTSSGRKAFIDALAIVGRALLSLPMPGGNHPKKTNVWDATNQVVPEICHQSKRVWI